VYASSLTTAEGAFPKLASVGGSVEARSLTTAEGAFPKLASVGGYVDASSLTTAEGAFPKLASVGESVYARSLTTAEGAFPKLASVGGSVYARRALPGIRTHDESAPATCRRHIFQANLKIGYYFADGILARLINRKGRVARVIVCGNTAMSYVVDDGSDSYSHGATLDEARKGLLYKLSSRDTAPFKKWNPQTMISLVDAIKAYRAITGACEFGTRRFCEQAGRLPSKLTIADAIKRTRGQYGSEEFAKFFIRA
jgi:hypothetical protein